MHFYYAPYMTARFILTNMMILKLSRQKYEL
jgi:hypothetical protein